VVGGDAMNEVVCRITLYAVDDHEAKLGSSIEVCSEWTSSRMVNLRVGDTVYKVSISDLEAALRACKEGQ